MPAASGEPLLLVVSGRCVWSARERAALALTRHEFIPESQYHPHDLRSLLPLRMIPTRSGARRTNAKSRPGRPMILVIDGDDRQGILAKLLESYGYSVQYTERSRAIEVLASHTLEVSVIITGGMQGLEHFADRVPIILTTGEHPASEAESALARRVMKRPIVLREILSAVQELGGLPHPANGAVPIR
jgi:CheY-like chemotaxis protein